MGRVAGLAAGDDHRDRAVIDARRVAGRSDAVLEQRTQFGQRGHVGLGPGMLVFRDADRPGTAARHLDRDDLVGVEAIGLGGGVYALRSGGEDIGRFAGDLVIARQVVGGFRHRVGAVAGLDLRVREARADRRVEDTRVAAERGLGLAHDKRRAAHALDAAGDEHIALAAGDRLRRHRDRVQAGAAIALQHRARDLDRQSGDQRSVARHAAAVLAGLIGAADDDILDLLGREAAIGDDPGDDPCEHVVGPQPRERAGMASERAAPTGIEISVEHGAAPS